MMRANNKDLQARVTLHCLRPGWLCALLGSCQTWRQGCMSPGAQFVCKRALPTYLGRVRCNFPCATCYSAASKCVSNQFSQRPVQMKRVCLSSRAGRVDIFSRAAEWRHCNSRWSRPPGQGLSWHQRRCSFRQLCSTWFRPWSPLGWGLTGARSLLWQAAPLVEFCKVDACFLSGMCHATVYYVRVMWCSVVTVCF